MGMLPRKSLKLIKGLGLSIPFIATPVFAQPIDASQLDWVPRSELSEEQLANCPTACRGAYVNPARNGSASPDQSPIEGLADSSEINTASETAVLEGNVEFTQGSRQIRADRVEIDRIQGKVALEGDVSIREPGVLLAGDAASIDSRENRVEVEAARYVLHEQRIRGSADHIERSAFAGISIDNASYTACEPGDEAWVLYAGQLHIDEQTGRVTARDVKLEVANMPVAYVPWFQFMVDDRRASGLLYPEIGYSTDEGFKYAQPYYLNLAPNQDLTLTPRLATKRGLGLEAEYRLLTEQSYSLIAGSYFPDDDVNPVYSKNRWASAIQHFGTFGQVHTRIDVEAVSDDDFLDDWATQTVTKSDRDVFLKQHVRISSQMGNWNLSASTRGYQNLIEDNYRPYRELPRLNALGQYQFGNVGIELDSEITRFDLSDDQPVAGLGYFPDQDFLRPEGNRLRLDWSAGWNKQTAWGYVHPQVGAAYRAYKLDAALRGKRESAPSAFAAEASLDAGLVFDRQTSVGSSMFTQTLEPRLYYLYRDADQQNDLPVFDTSYATESYDQLFRDSIYVGGDRMEDANRLTIGLESRFYSIEAHREVVKLAIGQSLYLDELDNAPVTFSSLFTPGIPVPAPVFTADEEQVLINDIEKRIRERQRNHSDLIGEVRWNMTEQWSTSANLFWDTGESELAKSRLELNYQSADSSSFIKLAYLTEDNFASIELDPDTLSAYLVNQDIAQLSVRGQWGISEQWNLVFAVNEDLENDRNLDRLFGVSYESCCWNLTLGWRDRLERSINDGFVVSDPQRGKSIILSFEFIGLGGVGRSGTELVEAP